MLPDPATGLCGSKTVRATCREGCVWAFAFCLPVSDLACVGAVAMLFLMPSMLRNDPYSM
jgi:hypothetical protein